MVSNEQIKELVDMVFAAYPNYSKSHQYNTVCNLYYLMLKDEEYSSILENLKAYVAVNDKQPPTPKNLLNKQPKSIVPSHKETMEYLASLEPKPEERLTREQALELARKAGLNV